MRPQFIRSLYGGGALDPSTLNSLEFWYDGTDTDIHTYGIDSINRAVSEVTDKSTNAYVIERVNTSTASADHGSYNGEAIYLDGFSSNEIKGNKTNFKHIHDGSAFTLYISAKILTGLGTRTFMQTAEGNNSVGFELDINRNLGYLGFFIYNGTGSTVINVTTANGSINLDAYNTIKIVGDGSGGVEVFINGLSEGTDSETVGTYSSNDHTEDFGLEAQDVYVKHIMSYNGGLSNDEQTSIESFLASSQAQTITETDINMYFIAGQSNAAGRALDSEVDGSLIGNYEYVLSFQPQNNSGISYFDITNIDTDLGQLNLNTQHGFWLKFINDMPSNNDFMLVCSSEGGTDLETNWVKGGATYNAALQGFEAAISEAKHIFRKTVVARAFIWAQGENDAQDVAPENADYYQTNLEDFFKDMTDDLIAANVDTTNMRITILRIADDYAPYDSTSLAAVRAAQDYVGANLLTDFPSYTSKIKSIRTVSTDTAGLNTDNLHYSAAGCFDIGEELAAYYDDFVNE